MGKIMVPEDVGLTICRHKHAVGRRRLLQAEKSELLFPELFLFLPELLFFTHQPLVEASELALVKRGHAAKYVRWSKMNRTVSCVRTASTYLASRLLVIFERLILQRFAVNVLDSLLALRSLQ